MEFALSSTGISEINHDPNSEVSKRNGWNTWESVHVGEFMTELGEN